MEQMTKRSNWDFTQQSNDVGHHFGELRYKQKVIAMNHDNGLDVQRSLAQQMIQAVTEDLEALKRVSEELDRMAGHG